MRGFPSKVSQCCGLFAEFRSEARDRRLEPRILRHSPASLQRGNACVFDIAARLAGLPASRAQSRHSAGTAPLIRSGFNPVPISQALVAELVDALP